MSSVYFTHNCPSTMSHIEFIAQFGSVYEHSPWVAEKVWRRGIDKNFDHKEHLIAAIRKVVDNAGSEACTLILRAHPELGANKEAFKALTDASKQEQSSSGLAKLADKPAEEMKKRNQSYRQRFGFPFIVAVKGLSLEGIIHQFDTRIHNAPSTEYARAIEQVHAIAKLRIYAIT